MRIGFTGTREGLTEQQDQTLIQVLQEYRQDARTLTLLPKVLPDRILDWLRMRMLGFGD